MDSSEHRLFLKGWRHQKNGHITRALKRYKEAIVEGDQCAVFHWNCMDRYGQGVPINFRNEFYLSKMTLTDEEFQLLLKCYTSVDCVESRFNIGILYDIRKEYKKAFEQFMEVKGYAPAQNWIGNCYDHGTGVVVDHEEAFRWYQLGATNDQAPGADQCGGWYISIRNLGYCYHGGEGVEKDYVKAYKWFQTVAELGCKVSQYLVGNAHYHGYGVPQNSKEAHKWFLLSGNQNDIDACWALYRMYRDDIKDYVEAKKWLSLAVNHDNYKFQKELSSMYSKAEQPEEAIKGLLPLAEGGDMEAQIDLAMEYTKIQDFVQAHKWFLAAAERGSENGRVNVGLLYRRGLGVEQNIPEAIKWFQSEPNNTWAQEELGLLYLTGEGVVKDKIRGLHLIYQSASKGYYHAQYILGVFYNTGKHTTKDETEALKWWDLAAKNGSLSAQYKLGIHHFKLQNYGSAQKYLNLVLTNPNPEKQFTLVQKAGDKLIEIDNIRLKMEHYLNDYIKLDKHEGTSYLFFCNFMRELIREMPNTNHDELFRTWITDALISYFKRMHSDITSEKIGEWFVELFGE